MFGTKHLKINQLQKTTGYQTNEKITKYSYLNTKIQKCCEIQNITR